MMITYFTLEFHWIFCLEEIPWARKILNMHQGQKQIRIIKLVNTKQRAMHNFRGTWALQQQQKNEMCNLWMQTCRTWICFCKSHHNISFGYQLHSEKRDVGQSWVHSLNIRSLKRRKKKRTLNDVACRRSSPIWDCCWGWASRPRQPPAAKKQKCVQGRLASPQ